MSLKYILDRVRSSAGFTNTELAAEQRALLLDFINEACDELYNQTDLPFQLQECNIQINIDEKTIALPAFVGELRAVRDKREYEPNSRWSLVDTRPRYVRKDWENKWNKFRILGEAATVRDLENASPLTYTTTTIDTNLIITVVGETEDSNNAFEDITMNALVKNGTKNFTSIKSIRKNKPSADNVVITDVADNEMALLYADRVESVYKIIDVSEYPDLNCCGDGFVMEILYKPSLNRLYFDHDEFPVPGYDDILVLSTKQLLAEESPGNEQRALLMDRKVDRKIHRKQINKTGTTQKRLTTSRNPFYSIFRRRVY
jgi:hypothetical protein